MKRRGLLGLALLTLPLTAAAHSFGRLYNLPVPVWMYLFGAAAALAASFLVIGFFATSRHAQALPTDRSFDLSGVPAQTPWLRALALLLLLLCIATGLWGTRNAYANFSMTHFWIVFVLGLAYASALFGNLYAHSNAWETLALGLARLSARYRDGLLRYPEWLGYWPALAFYMAFIWIELFGQTNPYSLALILLGYTALNLAGAGLFGLRSWFKYCEFFAVFFRLVALMAPLAYDRETQRLTLRWPFAGLRESQAASMSLVVFVLFMLSSTAFDGLRETVPWVTLFWVEVHGALKPWLGEDLTQSYQVLQPLYRVWQSFWLLASPFVYLGIYLMFLWLARLMAGHREIPLRELALRFAWSLLPIALVYNVTHYFTLILTQGLKIIPLASDPFGKNWDLFGTVRWFNAPFIPDAGWVWHTQVALILLGHIVSVYLAHLEALRIFPTRKAATLSQLPMLVLMMVFTTAGLWILAQPIQAGY